VSQRIDCIETHLARPSLYCCAWSRNC